jgi:hypothetical protein
MSDRKAPSRASHGWRCSRCTSINFIHGFGRTIVLVCGWCTCPPTTDKEKP